eukprot:365431-Chlamydomonas_euryale.AAC.7
MVRMGTKPAAGRSNEGVPRLQGMGGLGACAGHGHASAMQKAQACLRHGLKYIMQKAYNMYKGTGVQPRCTSNPPCRVACHVAASSRTKRRHVPWLRSWSSYWAPAGRPAMARFSEAWLGCGASRAETGGARRAWERSSGNGTRGAARALRIAKRVDTPLWIGQKIRGSQRYKADAGRRSTRGTRR